MSKPKQWKYKSKFNLFSNIEDKDGLSDDSSLIASPYRDLIAQADLDDLRTLLPPEEQIEENPDLLYTAFNAAVVNLINANDDGIMTDTALQVARFFKDKHMNVEHMRGFVVGHITNYGFSTFATNEMIDPEKLKGTKEPFNIALSAIVYKVVDSYFADHLEQSAKDKGYYAYQRVATSWELGFDEFVLALGSKKIADAELVTDDKQIEELVGNLRGEGGTGFLDDGTPIFRVVTGNARPLGVAFTERPAAAVQGITVATETEENNDADGPIVITKDEFKAAFKELAEKVEDKNALIQELAASVKTPETENNDSQNNKKNVKKYTRKAMKVRIEDIDQEWLAEAKASDVRDMFKDGIDKANQEWLDKQSALETAKAEIETQLSEANDKVAQAEKKATDAEKEVKNLNEKVTNLENAIATQKADADFNARMAEITENYNLSDDQRKAVAAQVKALSDDDSFDAWKANFALFATVKSDNSDDSDGGDDGADDATSQLQNTDTTVSNASLVPDGEPMFNEDKLAALAKSFKVGEGVSIQPRR